MGTLLGIIAIAIAGYTSRQWAMERLRLQERIDRLEQQVSHLRVTQRPETAAPPTPTPQIASPIPETRVPVTPTASEAPRPPVAAQPPVGRRPQPAPRVALEERLGARLPVWIGSAFLVLAAVSLFVSDVLSPGTRVAFAVGLGIAAIAGGEFLRGRTATVSQGLVAAGVGTIYAAVLAATNAYQLIGVGTGFAWLIVHTVLAVGLSLRHGPIVALVGVLGGFAHPALLDLDSGRSALFGYFALLQLGVLALARHRGWWTVGMVSAALGLLWAGYFIWLGDRGGPVGVFLLVSIASFAVLGRSAEDGDAWEPAPAAKPVSLGGSILACLLLGVWVGRGDMNPIEWTHVGVLGAGALALSRLSQAYTRLAFVAGGVTAALLLAYLDDQASSPGASVTLLAFTVLYAGGAWVLHHGAPRLAALSGGAGIVGAALGWAAFGEEHDVAMSLAALAGAVAFALATLRARQTSTDEVIPLAAFSAAAATLAAMACGVLLDEVGLTLAWGALIPVYVIIAIRLEVPLLLRLAATLAVVVGSRLLLNPWLLDYTVATTPVLNALFPLYAIPALGLAIASEALFRANLEGGLARALRAGAIAIGTAMGLILIHHGYHGSLDAEHVGLREWGTISSLGFGYAWMLLCLNRRWPRDTVSRAATILTAATVVQAALAQCFFENPIYRPEPVGETWIFNWLLLAFGLPALLAVAIARHEGTEPSVWRTRIAGAGALLLLFALVSFEVRQAFHGTYLDGQASSAEVWSYSAAWVVLGTALLVLGIVTRGATVRFGSLAVMVLAVGKVLFVDTAELDGLYRVLSLAGVGASLLLLAFLYQRFVFTGTEPASAGPASGTVEDPEETG